jgi:protein-tyrosine-phosphatase
MCFYAAGAEHSQEEVYMGKRRNIEQVLVVDSDGNCLSPLFAGYLNSRYGAHEGPTNYWCDYARAFPHDHDSPKFIDQTTLSFMMDTGVDLTGIDKHIRTVNDFDLAQFSLIVCFNLESAAEVRGHVEKIDANDRPRVVNLTEMHNEFPNPAGNPQEIKRFAGKIKELAYWSVTERPNVEPTKV